MILDKIKKLHAKFGHLNDDEVARLGFTPRIEDVDTLKWFLREKGKWSALHFSNYKDLTFSMALKIVPDIDGSKWPSYRLYQGGGGEFYACNMVSTILFNHINGLNTKHKLCKKYSAEWDSIYETTLPVYKLFGGKDDLQDIKDIVFNKERWPKPTNNKDDEVKRYRAFCLSSDPSYGNLYLWGLLDELIKSKLFLAEIPTGDLGIYRTRIIKLIGIRAWLHATNGVSEKLLTLIFDGFKEQHGYDTAELYPDYTPSLGPGETGNIQDFTDLFSEEWNADKISVAVKTQPEFLAVKALNEQGESDFDGTAFLQAAAILDEKYNDPKRAWNCLVSAGFWAGKNLPEAQDTIVKAAVYLCEKHNWLEAAEVLKYNLNIMQSV